MADTKISDLAAVTDVLGTDEFVLARAGDTKKIDAVDLVSGLSTSVFDAYALLRDEKAANTQGGTFTSGAWRTRDLNTEVDPDAIVSLASNQFELAAGSYLIRARAPAALADRHKLKVANITDTTDAIIGQSNHAQDTATVMTTAFLTGRVTIAATKTFELQHRCETTRATDGFGVACNFGVVEIYAEVEIWREP